MPKNSTVTLWFCIVAGQKYGSLIAEVYLCFQDNMPSFVWLAVYISKETLLGKLWKILT